MKIIDSAKVKDWFKGLFVSTSDSEAKLLTVAKKDGTQTVISSILCAFLGIFIGYLILVCINAEHAGEAMKTILSNFGFYKSPEKKLYYFGSTIVKAAPLIMCGLSVMFAYKAGLFNIGVGGQYCVGICFSLYAALVWQLPWYACILIAGVMGALWGAISGIFKALFNVNEVIACIMTNWIGLYMTNILLSDERAMNPTLSETHKLASNAPQALIPSGGLSELFNNNKYVTIAVIFTLVIAVVILVVMNFTTFGYELKATGHNKFAAKYAGMKDKRNIIVTMAIAGALAGLGAAFFYLTGIEQYKTSSSVPAMGFNGIAVAFLGGLNPIGVVFAGYFVQHITLGGARIDTTYYNPQVADLMIAIIIYLCAFVLFFKQFMNKSLGKITDKLNKTKVVMSTPNGEEVETPTAQDAAQTDDTTVEENEKTPEEEIIDDVNKEIEEITPPNVEENTHKGDETK